MSWPTQSLPPTSPSEPNDNAGDSTRVSPARTRTPLKTAEADIFESPYERPSSRSRLYGTQGQSSSISMPARKANHGRSMSHPFPSLFSGRKKHHGNAGGTAGYESTDDETFSPSLGRNEAKLSGDKTTKFPPRDLMAGKCMTCDSMVRWPKELKVFRCTVCLTINDLKPVLDTRHGSKAPAPTKAVISPASRYLQKGGPISLENTKQLVDQCLTAYLLDRLKHEGCTSSPVPSPLQSPTFQFTEANERDEIPSKIYKDKPSRSQSAKMPPPAHVSGRQVEEEKEQSNTRIKIVSQFTRTQSVPQLMSTPDVTFVDDMKQRDPELQLNSLGSPKGTKLSGKNPLADKHVVHREDGNAAGVQRAHAVRNVFKQLEDYIITSFSSFECVNTSFTTLRPVMTPRAASEGSRRHMVITSTGKNGRSDAPISELDAKTLLLGDFAENGSWWTGSRADVRIPGRSRISRSGGEAPIDSTDIVTLKSARIDWAGLNEWYSLVLYPGRSWRRKLDHMTGSDLHTPRLHRPSDQEMDEIGDEVMMAQYHTQRVLLRATESLLKRPGRPLNEPDHLRFLLILLENPLLQSSHLNAATKEQTRSRTRSRDRAMSNNLVSQPVSSRSRQFHSPLSANSSRGSPHQHSNIIKRILGLFSNLPNECHHHLVSWFARYSENHLQRTVDIIGSFVTYRLLRQHGKRRAADEDPTAPLVPNITALGRNTSAALHAAIGVAGQSLQTGDRKSHVVIYSDDWQIKAAARVMALVFSANNSGMAGRIDASHVGIRGTAHNTSAGARERTYGYRRILATSDFYNTLLDYSDLIADFEAWEGRRGKFAFCQYPFFLSIWAKIQIMEYDARRQMEVKAREAFFDSIMTHKSVNQHLVLRIRRDCLVEDSLKGVSEVVGTGGEEIKKGLRIEFKGEEGIDAGGLRKEWFLLLVRDVFNPEHGMFTYDEDSHVCYFNPDSFETTDQFFLVGVVLGLAIYNSTILDVALPPFAFRKLLAASPTAVPGAMPHAKPSMTYSLEDLAEYRPALASGLRQLLEYEGDVENTFCRDFVADVARYGEIVQLPLCLDGQNKPVTNSNRREFVDLYVRYILDTAVARQFEPFKRGFFTVCGGNALSLFRPEEIELLIRGSDEPLDIASLRAVSVCESWGVPNASETEPVVQWFWQSFQTANPKHQRKLLSFITGSDRIPAMGATSLIIKLSCLGDDGPRFPVARTCFNTLSLWRYASRPKLETMLWRAVNESEGFGLK